MLVSGMETLFQMLAIAGHAETEKPINERGKDITFGGHAQLGGIYRRLLHAAKQIE